MTVLWVFPVFSPLLNLKEETSGFLKSVVVNACWVVKDVSAYFLYV